ncbi:hypothetical protein NQZ68_031555 [Dissostichus eleginoides]|nr:hypothetical protein NQZ68_031555 [Dissostichus eleginoides]
MAASRSCFLSASFLRDKKNSHLSCSTVKMAKLWGLVAQTADVALLQVKYSQ